MGAVSPAHLIIVLIIALLILGPGKLPETGAALGKAVRELRRAMADEPTTPSPTGASPQPASTAMTDAAPVATNSPDGGATPQS